MEKLFEPIKIGNMELKNRIVMPAMGLGYTGKRLINFYVPRAKGGVGFIVIGPTAVNKGNPSIVNAFDDKNIPGLKKLADAIQENGSKAALQLWHPGRYGFSTAKLVSASDIPAPIFTKAKPKALTIPEIIEIEDEFADGALRVKKAGFDAVEILGGTGYLISQFLSARTNKRTDEYGGDLENRMKFFLEIIEKVRAKIGDLPLLCRISGDEFVEGGNTHSDQKIIARALEDAGVDALNVNVGWHESRVPQMTMSVPRGGFVHLAQGIKEVVDIPVIASHRINDPILADNIISEGKVDMVAMARALIADPELPNKAKEGRFEEIRPCIACLQGCFDNVFKARAVTCFMNAMAGKEEDWKIGAAESPKKIVVVGGGPAGMEAARVAALRGHNVTLYEKDRLGGQLNLAAMPPGRGEFKNVPTYYSTQLKKLGVDIKQKEANAGLIMGENPDVVVIATGSTPAIPDLEGVNEAIKEGYAVTAHEILGGEDSGDTVVIMGGGGIGVETALYLSDKGKNVTLVEMLKRVGSDIGSSTRWTRMAALSDLNVNVMKETKAMGITDGKLIVEKDGKREDIKADTIVLAAGTTPDRSLLEALEGKVEVRAVGDCVEPKKGLEAVHAGFELARKL
ncbi:MAG: FAD-dependent oxidoreductase [Halobacteriota archaeon]|nr:FAD-dependent oxidoreductase [Halobacteriota archaeon]